MRAGPSAAGLGLVLLAALAGAEEPPAGCLKYGPEVVTLHGRIERQSYPGPPGYGSAKGGRRETYWFLRLDHAVCVAAGTDEYDPAQSGIDRVQLVFMEDDAYQRYRRLMGHEVSATGTLYGWQTIHHKTPLLIQVKELAAEPKR